jgi:hypothetical protein
VLLVTSFCPAPVRAAAPTLEYLHPAGGQQGTTVQVTAAGAFEPWPVSGWADHPGIHLEASGEKGKLAVRIDKGVPAGPHLLRLHNAEGASAPRVFVVGGQPELAEAEPNNELAQATAVPSMPATVNARLEQRGDVDSFSVKLEAGQTLVASLQGRRLGAPMDPLLHLHDAAGGQPVAFAHDGFGLDPLLVYRAERAGTYVVRVAAFADPPAADVSFTGAANAVYRLSLTTGPFVRSAFPAGVSRGTKSAVQLRGWNLGPGGAETSEPREVDAAGAPADADHVMVPVPGGEHLLRIELGDGPELTDADPRVSGPGAAPLDAPVALNGTIGQAGEEDVLRFAAKKDERFVLTVRAGAAGARLDAALRIEDDAGKPLANDDDAAGNGDPRIEWPAPADGVYRAVVSDLYGAGGPDCVYRLALVRPQPRVTATLDAHEYRLAPGGTATIKLAVARTHGHAEPLFASATDLPPGVTCPDVEVPAAAGEVTLTLTPAADATAVAVPIRVVLRSPDPQRPAMIPAAFDLSKDNAQGLVSRTETVWLTVLPAAPPPPKS